MTSVPSSVSLAERNLVVTWADGRTSTYLYFWLRDNAPELMHASTKHRVVETSEIPVDVAPSSATVDAHGNVIVTWAYDSHVSTFPPEWLAAYDYSNGVRYQRRPLNLWDASIGESLPDASYPKLQADDNVRRVFLRNFLDYGVAVLRDVPCVFGTVLEVGRLLGEIRVTSWGEHFDVVSMEDANSVAYTNLPLVTHTDEGYRNPAPSIQLQHFLRADASGGESTLVDGFKIAEDLRRDEPAFFDVLSTTILDFHFADATAEHHNDDPIIGLRPDGTIKQIRYSNHSVLPFLMEPERMELFYDAYRAYGRMRESDEYQLRLKLGAGDMYLVDNHRVLHGRTGFSSGGARHLQSCYIERDEVASRLAVLERQTA